MSVKSLPMWGCAANDSQLCVSNLVVGKQCRVSFNLRVGSFGNLKLECLGWSGEGAKTDVGDDEALAKQDLDSLSGIHEKKIGDASKVFDKDFKFLPKPLSATPKDGSKVRVAYQGVPGAYSETAALTAFPDCETVPCNKFESLFKAVELWLVDKAILPIENSLGGSLHRNYDLLLRHRLHIVGEVQLLVDHCLLGLPGVRKEDLKRVLSHPQALEQCEMTLNKLGVVKIKANDTAGAAQIVAARRMRDTAAIASSRAAEIYGLDVIAAGMQDKSENITRYLILSREPIIPGTRRPHKTSIVFSLEKGPGMLFQALAVFSLRDINLSKIESRPQRKRPLRVVEANNKGCAKYFDYLFYIDFEASMAEPRAQFALEQLQELATFIRVLGCYPVNTIL